MMQNQNYQRGNPNDDYSRPALSPVGSDWSGISRYQSFQSDAGPPPAIPPPRNGSLPIGGRRPSQASMNSNMGDPRMMDRGMGGGPMDRGMGGPMDRGMMMNGQMDRGMGGPMDRMNGPMGGPMNRGMGGGPPMSPMDRGMPMSPMDRNQFSGGPRSNGNGPSPPASVARSSDTSGLYSPETGPDGNSLSSFIRDEEISARHAMLKRLLGPNLTAREPGVRTNAQDKLDKLSLSQFAELSEDVHDELCRREGIPDPDPDVVEGEGEGEQTGEKTDEPPPIPKHLPIKKRFYFKRNQARMRLYKLAQTRFYTLASDIFYELERRYPQLLQPGRPGSANGSMNGQFPPQRLNSPGPGRVGSPGPNGMRNGPGGPGQYGGPPRLNTPGPMRNGSPSPGPNGPQNQFGRPLPKTFQNNTIIPNISTMVEEGDDDNDSYADLAGGYDGNDRDSRASAQSNRPGSTKSRRSIKTIPENVSSEADKKLIADYQVQVEGLKRKIEELESKVGEKEEKLGKIEDDERKRETQFNLEKKEWQDMRLNLEEKCIDAEKLNASLQNEIARLKADNAAVDRSRSQQLEEQAAKHSEQIKKLRADHESELREREEELRARGPVGGASDDARVDELMRENEQLKMEIREQEEVTEEVRREATEFLEQMRELSQDSEKQWEREEALHSQIQKLEEDVREWKGKYAKIKTQLRSIRAASMGLPMVTAASALGKDGNLKDANGLVKDVHITKYQIAIDDLLRMARNGEAAIVLDYMKTVIMATRQITHGIDENAAPDSANADALMKAKVRVSATANNLITASKNHATGSGLSPVSLLDAAASHLTAAMVELIKVAKIKPTPASEVAEEVMAEEDDDSKFDSSRFPNPPSYGQTNGTKAVNGLNVTNGIPAAKIPNGSSAPALAPLGPMSPPRYSDDSVYSTTSTPSRSSTTTPPNLMVSSPNWAKKRSGTATLTSAQLINLSKPGPAFGIRTSTANVSDLQQLVATEFSDIGEMISSLLVTIREGQIPVIQEQMLELTTVVGKVLDSTEKTMSQSGNSLLRERGGWVVKSMAECRMKMLEMVQEDEAVSREDMAEFKSRASRYARDMAKKITQLVNTVEDIDANEHEYQRPGLAPGIKFDDEDDYR